jgi:hypothetical protein
MDWMADYAVSALRHHPAVLEFGAQVKLYFFGRIISAEIICRRDLPAIEKIEHFGFVLPKKSTQSQPIVV